MTFQRHIAASLEVSQADFALGDAEHMLHMPAHERGQQHAPQDDPPGCVGEEVFLLPRLSIPHQDQSVSRPTVGPQSHFHDLRLPDRCRAGLLLEAERLRCPFLHARLSKYGLGAQRGPASSRPTRERLGHFPHVSQARQVQHAQEPRLAAVPLVERQPVEPPAVTLSSGQQLQSDLPALPTDSGRRRGCPASRHRSRSASHDSGRNKLPLSSRAWRTGRGRNDQMHGDDTVGHPMPTQPRYCRCTRRSVFGPFLERATVSSRNANRAATGSGGSSATRQPRKVC